MNERTDRMPVVVVVGPYRAETHVEVRRNIERAREVAERLWRYGVAPLCPALNSAWMSGLCAEEAFLLGALEFVRRADAIATVWGWAQSAGSRAEVALAERLALPVFDGEATPLARQVAEFVAEWRERREDREVRG